MIDHQTLVVKASIAAQPIVGPTPGYGGSISVIVPAYNAANVLPVCLMALNRQTRCPDEIIVVDDGSTDHTAQVAGMYGAKVVRQQRSGPAAARNLGVQHALGDLILFTDADCQPMPEWVDQLSRSLIDTEVAGAKGAYCTQQRSLVARFVQQEYEYKYAGMAHRRYIDFVDTYSAVYRRDVFLQNGGFDAVFTRPSVEDQEFSFRLARKGYRMVFAPQAIVGHLHDGNVREYIRRKFGIGYWKAAMVRWLPDKAFSDSHTPRSQRWQILIMGLTILGMLADLIALPAAWYWVIGVLAVGFIMFMATAVPFLNQIWRHDRAVFLVTPFLLVCRAASLSAGLVAGFVLPPARRANARVENGPSLFLWSIKRLMDIAGALCGLVVSAPLVAIAAVAIKLDSKGPVLFVQERAGEYGKPFRMVKLRTMVDGADRLMHDLLARNPLNGPAFKLPDDPRVTQVGRRLRRWSIDELPQFWNVLRGDMSLVGPRPEQLAFVDQYTERQRRRLIVKPGLTGPVQVSGRGCLDFEDRLRLELDYIEHYSLWKDIVILARTVAAILSGKGAY